MNFNISDEYINMLTKKYLDCNGMMKEKYNKFEENKVKISYENKVNLINEYPDIPDSLINLLEYCDGSKPLYFFSSDIENGRYPYYLLSSKKILENKNIVQEYYSDFISRSEDYIKVDNRITTDIDNLKWLHFSDCMNNGGTSQLFIDFTPSSIGTKGQVVRYLHDPDCMDVIAESFDTYLRMIMNNGMLFIDEN